MGQPGPRKERILDAALREFSQRGLAGARTATIADAAGVNKQLIFYYFRSKAGLYDAVLQTFVLAPIAHTSIPDSATGPVERIRAVLNAFVAALGSRPEVGALLVRAVSEPGSAHRALGHALGDLEGRLSAIVTEGQRHGYVRDDADPRAAAGQIVSLMLGYLLREAAETAGPASKGRTLWVDSSTDLVTRALRW